MIGIKKGAPAVYVRKESQRGYYKFMLLPWHGGSRGASCQNWGSALSEANMTMRSIHAEGGYRECVIAYDALCPKAGEQRSRVMK